MWRNYKLKQDNAIEINGVKKKFKVFYDKGTSLKEKLLFRKRNRYEERWVLKGINIDIKKGEAVGLIGKNGCGKSTTLKLISRIMYPTEGTIEVTGRVSSLLELGAGFHPDMSGRENIYTNASIFGLTRKEINERIDDIIAFSELEEFIDNPVRTYSSGMYMRLAFSVAINVDADILLIDEILAVGDVSFQTKCFEKLKSIKSSGTTIVIVSHSPGQIEQICDRAIWIEDGIIKENGIPKFVGEHYLVAMEEKRLDRIEQEFQEQQEEQGKQEKVLKDRQLPSFCTDQAIRLGNQKAVIANCCLTDSNSQKCKVFKNGQPLIVEVSIHSQLPNLQVDLAVSISRDDGLYCYGHTIYHEKNQLINLDHQHNVKFTITELNLLNGKYFINLGVYSNTSEEYDVIWNVIDFQVTSPQDGEVGIFRIPHQWSY